MRRCACQQFALLKQVPLEWPAPKSYRTDSEVMPKQRDELFAPFSQTLSSLPKTYHTRQEDEHGGENPYLSKCYEFSCWNPTWCGPHCQLESWSFRDLTAFVNTPCLHMFCNKDKMTKHHPPLQQNPLCLQTCAIRKSHLHPAQTFWAPVWMDIAVIIEKWKHWFIQRHCCWGWQQVHDWERPPGCKRKGIKQRNTEWNWSEGKWVSDSQLTESSTRLSGTNAVNALPLGSYSAPAIILTFLWSSCLR